MKKIEKYQSIVAMVNKDGAELKFLKSFFNMWKYDFTIVAITLSSPQGYSAWHKPVNTLGYIEWHTFHNTLKTESM